MPIYSKRLKSAKMENNKTESEIRAQIQKTIKESFQNEEKINNYFGWEGEEPTEELAPEDLFGDEADQATRDIRDEYGEEETAPFGSMEDTKKFVDAVTGEDDLEEGEHELHGDDVAASVSAFSDMSSEYGEEEVVPAQSYQDDKEFIDTIREEGDGYEPAIQDSEGSKISRGSMVTDLSSGKRGRVTGYKIEGDNLMLNVDFTGDEWGQKGKLNPSSVKADTTSENTEIMNEENIEEEVVKECGCAEDCDCNKEELEESGRGLGHGVKNSGDRLVKMNDDNAHSPISAAINESEEDLEEGVGISKTIEKGANLKPANHKGKKGKKKSKKAKKSKEKIDESISRLLENKEGLKVKDIKKFIKEESEKLYNDYQTIKSLDNLKESYNLNDETEGDNFFESLKS